ncbi:vomeronasal type-1 receptor 4 [Phodopus roborovskii]|uniref:Vomeronasal type-1 receptor n=1 Tax=Phodopus roborovskii TaxID=109678 RepID=A0AAV0A9W9_PHORO|nr:vomeronasal type-1 receptor 4 [Phodopus roborovskii]CAH7398715.1 Vom1r61 [Phodopus roborovskii]
MFPSDTILVGFLLPELCLGVIGNSLLLMLYVYSFLVKAHFSRPINLIFIHLMIVNVLTIIFSTISYVMASFGVRHFLDDAGCKAVLFVFRVTRGMSICTTSILSTFQAITITPSYSKWAWLKPKLPMWTFCSFLFSWFINLLMYVHTIKTVISKFNYTDVEYRYSHVYCKRIPNDPNEDFFLSVIIIGDVFFMAIMIWTSLYMVTLLYRHRKRAQHLHSISLSCQPSPERRATHSILLLVSCFVFFYWLNNFITLSGSYIDERRPTLGAIVVIVSSVYPTLCPFLLMSNNRMISQFFSSLSTLRATCLQRPSGD